MTANRASRPAHLRSWLTWTAGFLAFPLAGLAGTGVAGRVDSPLAALLDGAVAGLVIGAGQALASRGRLDLRRWAPATATGMGPGLLLGAVTVGYGTSLADLAPWTTTTLGGIALDNQFTVFGAYGAITFSALSGVLLLRLLPERTTTVSAVTSTPSEARA